MKAFMCIAPFSLTQSRDVLHDMRKRVLSTVIGALPFEFGWFVKVFLLLAFYCLAN